ncbi:MAG: hypothetical protein ACI8UX_002027 [Psychromonas sp.]|jgi:hypothetical protein
MPQEINETTRGVFTAFEFAKDSFLIIVMNFAFLLFTSQNTIQPAYRLFDRSSILV